MSPVGSVVVVVTSAILGLVNGVSHGQTTPAPAHFGSPFSELVPDSLVPGQAVPPNLEGPERGGGLSTDLSRHPRLVFTPVAGPGQAPPELRAAKTIDGFDAARFGFRSLRFVFDRELPPEADRSSMGTNGTLRLTVGLLGGAAGDRWYRMAPESVDGIATDEWLATTDTPGERVERATPDPSLPIVILDYGSSGRGANTTFETDTQLLIDFRGRLPRVIAGLDHTLVEGGGICGAFDNDNRVTKTVDCRWDASRGDFLCRERAYRGDTAWGERRASRYFFLDSGASYSPESSSPASPDIASLAVRWARENRPPATTAVSNLGRATALAELPSAQTGARLFLFGSESNAGEFDARFFLARVSANSRATVSEIQNATRVRDEAEESAHDPGRLGGDFARDGDPTTFRARVFLRRGNLTVVRVVVREMTGGALYWVGVEDGPKPVADALRVSTDTAHYDQCAKWVRPAAATGFTLASGASLATLRMEPDHLEDLDGNVTSIDPDSDEERVQCPYSVTVTWKRGRGFDLLGEPGKCRTAARPRIPVINDDGTLGSKPATHEKRVVAGVTAALSGM